MKLCNRLSSTDGPIHLYLEATYFCSVSHPGQAGTPPSTCRCTTRHCSHRCVHSHGLLLGRHLSLKTAEKVKTISPTQNFPGLHFGGSIQLSPWIPRASWAQWSIWKKVALRVKFTALVRANSSNFPAIITILIHQHLLHKNAIHYQLSADVVSVIRKETLLVWLLRRLILDLEQQHWNLILA